jgi:uncharacterized protein (DUF2236 family)
MKAQLAAMKPRLGRSPVIFEFLRIMRAAPILPLPLRPVQRMLIRAAVEIVPPDVRRIAGLGSRYGLRGLEKPLVRRIGLLSDRIRLDASPAARACVRLGLPVDYLLNASATSRSIRSSSPS